MFCWLYSHFHVNVAPNCLNTLIKLEANSKAKSWLMNVSFIQYMRISEKHLQTSQTVKAVTK